MANGSDNNITTAQMQLIQAIMSGNAKVVCQGPVHTGRTDLTVR